MNTSQSSPAPAQPAHRPGAPWAVADAALFLTISTRHVRRLIDAGRIRAVRVGRRVLVPDAEVRRVADRGL